MKSFCTGLSDGSAGLHSYLSQTWTRQASYSSATAKAIVVGCFIPGVGPLISIPAGIEYMPIYGWFLVAAIIWNGVLISLEWVLGSQWELVEQYARIVDYVVLAAIAGVIL